MKKYFKDKRIDITLTGSAKEHLADIGFDPVYGARPLKRAIQREVLNRLAKELLSGTFREGDTIEVDYQNGKLLFSKAVQAEITA